MSSSSGEEVDDLVAEPAQINHTDSHAAANPDKNVWKGANIVKLTQLVHSQADSMNMFAPYDSVEVDWEHVGSELGISAEKCKHKWLTLLKWVRTYRTISEVAQDIISQHSKKDTVKWNKKPSDEKREKKKKPLQNPDHPVKPRSSGYAYFCEEMAKTLPDIGVAKMLKLGSMWREMSDEEKAPYNNFRAQEIKKYYKEVEAYAKAHPDDKDIQKILAERTSGKSRNNRKSPKKESAEAKSNTSDKESKKPPKNQEKVPDTSKKSNTSMIESPDLMNDTQTTLESDSILSTPKKSPKKRKHQHKESKDDIEFSSPSKKHRKKMWTGEDVFLQKKFESYSSEHDDLSEEEAREKLKRKYAKLSDQKKAKYEEKAEEMNTTG